VKQGARRQIEEIFQEALQRDPAERDAFVRDACRGDAELQREVSSLLANQDEADDAGWAVQAAAQLIGAPASLQPGQSLGPYCIKSFVAAGGMGEVYRATDTRLGREVAIKVSAASFTERFEREARVIASLNHPNICQLYDVGPNYLVMEFVDGEPLKGPLPVEKAIEYAGQILDALDAAHRKGITHRDLKPGNILVTKKGVKLLDFGLAKQSGPISETDATRALTQQGQIAGTLQYMSPEQLQGEDADARSDLFAFGCVLYEMLSGKRAFEGQSAANVIAAILEREPASFEVALPLERIIQTCLAKDREKRFQNALDLKRALNWGTEQPIVAKQNRRAWTVAAMAALALGAFGGWAVSYFRQTPPNGQPLRLQIEPPPNGRFVLGGGTFGDLAISPDGKMAAYTASVNGKVGLWVRPLDGGAARLLPETEEAGEPFWSPDSRSLAFAVARNKLRLVDPGRGMRIEIGPVSGMRGASWGSDGYILFSRVVTGAYGMLGVYGTLGRSESGIYGIYRISAAGGAQSAVTVPDQSRGELAYLWPQVLPEGRFLYWVQTAKPEDSGIFVAPLSNPSKRVKLLTTESKAVYASGANGKGYVLWVRSGSLVAQEFDPRTLRLAGEPQQIVESLQQTQEGEVYVSASGTGLLLYGTSGQLMQLAWWDRTGHQLRELGEPIDGLSSGVFRPSPDARRIAISRFSGSVQDLWLMDTERGVTTRFTAGRTLTTQPVWSPDGQTILFTRFGSGVLLRKPANGIGEEQVVAQRSKVMFPYDWSRDGRWLLIREGTPDTKYDLWKLPMTRDGKLQQGANGTPYLQTRFSEAQGRFSPEPSPRWVAYMSDESGRPEVYIDAFPERHGAKRISISGGQFPKWGAGGRELFYLSPENKLMAVSLKLGTETVEPSAPRELFQLPLRSATGGPTYEPSSDGQRILVLTSPERAQEPLTVLVNWTALLKKEAVTP
jgi:Tol biopolymer transport system component/predicted Ser/Thr protein kinase